MLNGYEDAYFVCANAEDKRWESPPLRLDGSQEGEVTLFVRAQPASPGRGLTLHLLDRTNNRTCSGVSLRLRADMLSPLGDDLEAICHAPLPYDKTAHERTESRVLEIGCDKKQLDAIETSREYGELVKSTTLDCRKGDDFITITVPEFEIYTIVHIKASKN